MPGSDEERERELAELLREVRALRQTIEQLGAGQLAQPELPPDYAVLVRAVPDLPPEYQVLARSGAQAPAGSGEPAELPPEYQVLARGAAPALDPNYAVLARGATPGEDEQPASDS